MKSRVLIWAVALLSACAPVETKKEAAIPPLSMVVPAIKQGMNLEEVQQALIGHKPFLQYSYQGNGIWEIVERAGNSKNNSINANRLTIIFNPEGRVQETSSSFCFLPEVEPMLGSAPATSCYQKQLYPFDKKLTYDAIKRLLIISNYQVDHSDAASEIISATGVHGVEGNKDKMMFIKLTIIFSAQANYTEVVMSATFSLSEKQSTWVQAGFAGVTLPVPLPFQRTEEWIDSGIVTPKFYLEFYDALSKLIAREYLPYTPITTTHSAKALKAPEYKVEQSTPVVPVLPKETLNPNSTIKAIDAELFNLEGPIDGVQKNHSAKDDVPEAGEGVRPSGMFPELDGKPIDSKALKK